MRFKNFQLIKKGNFLNYKDIEVIYESMYNEYVYKDEIFLVKKKFIEDRFLWLYFEYDNKNLYGETILDRNELKTFVNTRNKDLIELRKQLFVIYDNEKQLLYINDYNRKSTVKNYLIKLFNELDITIKNIYTSLEEFENTVKYLKKVSFTRTKDLLASIEPDNIFSKDGNIFGLDMPDKYSLQVEYDALSIKQCKKMLQGLKRRRDMGCFDEIVLIGENDDGLEERFNFSTMIKNIEISPMKNTNDRYDPIEVERLIITELKKQDVQKR